MTQFDQPGIAGSKQSIFRFSNDYLTTIIYPHLATTMTVYKLELSYHDWSVVYLYYY